MPCLLWTTPALAPQPALFCKSPASARMCILQLGCLSRAQKRTVREHSKTEVKSSWLSLSGWEKMAQGWRLTRCVYGRGEIQAKKPHLGRWKTAGELMLGITASCWCSHMYGRCCYSWWYASNVEVSLRSMIKNVYIHANINIHTQRGDILKCTKGLSSTSATGPRYDFKPLKIYRMHRD